MGIVEEVGPKVKGLKRGDRVVSSFEMGCGRCFYCNHQLYSGLRGAPTPPRCRPPCMARRLRASMVRRSTLVQPLVWR